LVTIENRSLHRQAKGKKPTDMQPQNREWIGPIAPSEAEELLRQSFFGPQGRQASVEALGAEAIRIALWEQSAGKPTLIEAAVSTKSILNRARILIDVFTSIQAPHNEKSANDDEQSSEQVLDRQSLDDLAAQGDILELKDGWIPTPLRLVPITADRYLLAGGMPSCLLKKEIQGNLRLHASFRQLDVQTIQAYPTYDQDLHTWQFQTQESWLGGPAKSFEELLQNFQQIDVRDVQQEEMSPEEEGEIYVPSRNKPQAQRWLSPTPSIRNGRHLLRSRTRWGQRAYTIGEFSQGKLKKQSQELASIDIRRLCYALDNAANTPTYATWHIQQRKLILYSELPWHERKRLALIGTLQPNADGKYYPRVWRIAEQTQYEERMKEMLADLRIHLYLNS
jgi:hypothetical protein